MPHKNKKKNYDPMEAKSIELYDWVGAIANVAYPYAILDEIEELLKEGADPLYRPKRGHYTTVERAAGIGEYARLVMRKFLDHPGTDFNPRPGHHHKSPLMRMLASCPGHHACETCLAICKRMTGPVSSNSALLSHAIFARHYGVANYLIDVGGNHLRESNLLYVCCIREEDDSTGEVLRLARKLIAAGYRETWHTSFDPPNPREYYIAGSVLEATMHFDAYGMLDLVLPFAKVTCSAIHQLVVSGFCYQAIQLMDRMDFRFGTLRRDHSEPFDQLERKHPFIDILMRHMKGEHVIGRIMQMPDQARALFRMRGPMELNWVATRHQCTLYRYMIDLRAPFVCALLRQNAELHPTMYDDPTLRTACMPWRPQTTLEFFGDVFRSHAFRVMLAVEMSVMSDIPLEMKHRIVAHGPRN